MTKRMQTVMSAAVAALLVGATALPLAAQGPGGGMGPGGVAWLDPAAWGRAAARR